MRRTWYVERVMPVLFGGGLILHLIRVSRWLITGDSGWEQFLLRPVDAVLMLIMVYCSIALITRRCQLFESYDFSPRWRRICYWMFVVYVTASIPGHVLFLVTGNAAYFDIWPIWYSIVFLLYSLASAVFWVVLPLAVPGEVAEI